jgi:bifunctional NMN adenylyltransferase/nudix hydrolase
MSLPDPLSVGVIIGRFQVAELHPGHRKLFEVVLARHKRVLVLLGIPAWRGGIKNPLDYKTREQMIRSYYPSVTVSYVGDRQTNEEWSKDVDKAIRHLYPLEKIVLYGGRGGFTDHYSGIFPTIETLEDPLFDAENGTDCRNSTAALPRESKDFRAGIIYSSYSLPSTIVMCVDGAVLKHQSKVGLQVLLIRKSNELNWRFPGGKLEGTDSSLENACSREVREETGLEIGPPVYIGSDGIIPDWRGKQSGIGIASSLFYVPYLYGAAQAGDDAAETKWFILNELTENNMEPCHKKFLIMLQSWVQSHADYVMKYTYTEKEGAVSG